MCDFSQRAECVPTFACESERGPFVGEVEKRDERWSEVELLLIVGATENREMYVYKSVAESRLQMRRSEQFHWRHKAPLWTREGRPLFRRVSRCVRSFFKRRVVYPLSPVKANVGRLWEKLKSGMKSGLEQRCGGNFLTIFAETVLGEKPNFTGRFFEWGRPFDFSTDRL